MKNLIALIVFAVLSVSAIAAPKHMKTKKVAQEAQWYNFDDGRKFITSDFPVLNANGEKLTGVLFLEQRGPHIVATLDVIGGTLQPVGGCAPYIIGTAKDCYEFPPAVMTLQDSMEMLRDPAKYAIPSEHLQGGEVMRVRFQEFAGNSVMFTFTLPRQLPKM